jgi:phosphatidylinositol 4-kinase
MSKMDLAKANVTMAAQFFHNVWGESSFVTRALPVFIALSALGNVFAQSFAMPRGMLRYSYMPLPEPFTDVLL